MKLQVVTLDQIAAAAGVHKMTVSRALRNHPAVAPTTREKIQRIAQQLGYRPNPLLTVFQAHVRSRKAPAYVATLGWLVASVPRDYWERPWTKGLLEGARARASALGYKIDLIYLGDLKRLSVEEQLDRYRSVMHSRGIHGLIIPLAENPRFATRVWENTAVVAIGQHHIEMSSQTRQGYGIDSLYHTVSVDFFANMRCACEGLRKLGYRRIGLLLNPWLDNITDHQYRASFAFQQSLWHAREQIPILIDANTSELPSDEFRAWFRKYRPEAIIASTHRIADWLRILSMRVPEDIAIAHMWIAPDVEGWSGINPRIQEIGATAVDVLIHQLQHNELHPPAVPRQTEIAGIWVEGKTTRATHAPQSTS
ncbi:MAG: LacI family transcriptional regulator [Kiritimatiellae bacterium]|nr:LacI family transcriptional regulator [Kiritimatiellia bacterium]MDW8458028.1 LacI family DNA-binding transcriptional regulator [Verrucomicrobiota bacterium]